MTTTVHPYIESLLTGTRELPGTAHAWLNARRGAALERANALSVPTTREEDWRFTDLAPLMRLQLRAAESGRTVRPQEIAPYVIPEAGARLVFIDGVYAPALSLRGEPSTGVRVAPLLEALNAESKRLEPHLAQLAASGHNVFVALNTAHLRDA